MNRGNFLGQSNRDFPLDCETLDFIQTNQEMLAVLGQIGGDKSILSGCVKTGTTVTPGYIFLKTTQYPEGEVLKFDGGTIDLVTSTIYISETATSVTAQGYTYPQAYYTRSLKAGLGAEQFLWADFSRVETNAALKVRIKSLEDEVATLAPIPIGIPQMFTGYVSKIPTNLVLFDGRALNIIDYPEAYAVWGTMYNSQNGRITPSGQFRIPDMSGAFVVGYSSSDDDYDDIGKNGGKKEVTLTAGNIPKFSILARGGADDKNFSATDALSGADKPVGAGWDFDFNVGNENPSSIENRPPFFTVAFIGRIQ